jgi:hypothetical protein
MGNNRLPDGYLEFCSVDALESLLLARMNQAANLCAHAKQLLHQWVEVEAEAKVARWMLEKRRSQQLRAGESAQAHSVQQSILPLRTEILAPPAAPLRDSSALLSPWSNREFVVTGMDQSKLLNMPKTNANNCPRLQRASLPVRAALRKRVEPN